MYICKECGYIFEEPEKWQETHGNDNPNYFEDFLGCPICLSTDYTLALPCDFCGEFIEGEYVELKDKQLACNACYIVKDLEELI